MDETYIKMCDCPEVQKQWEPKVGDICCATERSHNNDVNEVCVVQEISKDAQRIVILSLLGLSNELRAAWFCPKNNIWLPRQEDTQEMLEKEGFLKGWDCPYAHVGLLQRFINEQSPKCESMEELYIQFYMSYHNKTWTEKGWA